MPNPICISLARSVPGRFQAARIAEANYCPSQSHHVREPWTHLVILVSDLLLSVADSKMNALTDKYRDKSFLCPLDCGQCVEYTKLSDHIECCKKTMFPCFHLGCVHKFSSDDTSANDMYRHFIEEHNAELFKRASSYTSFSWYSFESSPFDENWTWSQIKNMVGDSGFFTDVRDSGYNLRTECVWMVQRISTSTLVLICMSLTHDRELMFIEVIPWANDSSVTTYKLQLKAHEYGFNDMHSVVRRWNFNKRSLFRFKSDSIVFYMPFYVLCEEV